MTADKGKRNRIAINVEDSLAEAFNALVDAEGSSQSDIGRRAIIEYLEKRDLLPAATIRRLAGVS